MAEVLVTFAPGYAPFPGTSSLMFLERNQPPPHTVATVVFYHLKWGIRPTQSEGTAALLAGHMTQAEPMTGHRGLLP